MMEGVSETSVSLDELTLDMTSDVSDKVALPDFHDSGCNEEDINIELASSCNTERLQEMQADIILQNPEIQKKTDTVENNEETSSDNDFEADVPPLLLFPRKKEEDEEDFEFEFPEPVNTDPERNSTKNVSSSYQNNGKTVQFATTVTNNETTNEDVRIDSERKENLDPEIFTPRDKLSSELTTTILQEENNTSDEIKEVKSDLSEEASKISGQKESSVEVDSGTERSRHCIVTTAEDWDQVQEVVPGFAGQNESKSGAAAVIESKPLAKFSETWTEVSSLNYEDVKETIKPTADRRGISALTHFLFGPPKLHKDLLPERDLIFCLAATKFDNNSEVHSRVLQTIYRQLTGSKFDCQRYGSHWEEIGFQGQDPSTDLRGGGILSLLHLLYFLQDHSTKELARDIYKLSLHPTQNFPFCLMSINISVHSLRVIREDIYNREFNKRKDMIGTFNCLYAALFLRLYQLWKKGKTIHDSGYILEDVANYSRKSSKTIFKDLELYEKNRKDQNLFGDQTSGATFFNVCKQEKCDDKISAELY